MLAIAATASGLVPTRARTARRTAGVGFICATGIVVVVAVAAIGIQVGVGLMVLQLPEFRRYGLGLVITVLGGGVALAGARVRLHHLNGAA